MASLVNVVAGSGRPSQAMIDSTAAANERSA
jgi:hypothetical protein